MKRTVMILLAVCLLLGILSGCAGSIYPYRDSYSNVSTTDDGTVNGTNGPRDPYGSYGYGSSQYPQTGNPSSGTGRWNGTSGSADGYENRGTGMTRR